MDWHALLSAFGLVLVAELGDKTQLAVVAQACKYRQPWPVFLGASIALTAVTAIGATVGQVLGQFIPLNVLRLVAALAFVSMGLLAVREAVRAGGSGAQDDACTCEAESDSGSASSTPWRAFASTLVLLFVAEMGDKTQLAVLSLAGGSRATWPVFAGGALALVTVTALGVIGGESLSRLVPERALLWLAAIAFVAAGVAMGLGVL